MFWNGTRNGTVPGSLPSFDEGITYYKSITKIKKAFPMINEFEKELQLYEIFQNECGFNINQAPAF